jgi:hypothetical protein
MTRREAAKELVALYAEAVTLGVDDEQNLCAEVVALAVAALLKEGDNE